MSSTPSKKNRGAKSRPPKPTSIFSSNGSAELGDTTTSGHVFEREVFIRGCGNVFADLGFPNPEERLLKAQLMHAINANIERCDLTQAAAVELVGLSQADLSLIRSGQGSSFSIERLIDVLRRLGRDVEIVVTPAAVGPMGRS